MQSELDVKTIREITLKMTQAELAAAIGVDQSTVSNWENGRSPRGPAKKMIEQLVGKAKKEQAA